MAGPERDSIIDDIAARYYTSTKNQYLKEFKNSDNPDKKPRFLKKDVFIKTFNEKYKDVVKQLEKEYSIKDKDIDIDEILLPKLEEESSNPISFDSENGIKEGIEKYIKKSSHSNTIIKKIEQISPNIKSQVQENTVTNKENKVVDFNNPEVVNQYMYDFWNKYFEKDEEERAKEKERICGDDDIAKKAFEQNEAFQVEKNRILEENPNLSKKDVENEARKNLNYTDDQVKLNDQILYLCDNISKIQSQLMDPNLDPKDKKRLGDEQEKYRNELKELEEKKEFDIESIDIEGEIGQTQEKKDFDELFEEDIEESFDIESIEIQGENSPTQEKDDFEADTNKTNYISILGQAGEEEIQKEELNSDKIQTQETALVEYNPNRLRKFFNNIINKIKESNLFKKISGKNENNIVETNSIEPKMQQVNEEKNSFDNSLVVTEEEQKKYRIENEKIVKSKTVSLTFGDRDEK